ncbi:MAG: hypothetical protein MZV65_17865 [Chromatiales bacterium]|nr:hypothetical protein [Chromatiales bacterium]
MLGVFMARDWSLFYVFWELTLIPLFFLIDRLGGAATATAPRSTSCSTPWAARCSCWSRCCCCTTPCPATASAWRRWPRARAACRRDCRSLIFLGLFIGFGVKMPIFPLHGWLPLAHVEAPSPVSHPALRHPAQDGLLRPDPRRRDAARRRCWALQGWLAALAFVSLHLRRRPRLAPARPEGAWSPTRRCRHMGVVLLGIAALNAAGLTGAVMQMVAHGLVAGALFLLVGLLYERTHTRDIGDYSSLVRVMPRFAFFTVLAFVAAVGLPGTAGFVAELHALIGGFARWGGWVALLSLSACWSAPPTPCAPSAGCSPAR